MQKWNYFYIQEAHHASYVYCWNCLFYLICYKLVMWLDHLRPWLFACRAHQTICKSERAFKNQFQLSLLSHLNLHLNSVISKENLCFLLDLWFMTDLLSHLYFCVKYLILNLILSSYFLYPIQLEVAYLLDLNLIGFFDFDMQLLVFSGEFNHQAKPSLFR